MSGTDEFRGYGGRMLASLSLGWAVLQTGRFILSPLLPSIIEGLHITKATAGLALTAFQLTYGLTQYPSGRLSDRWSRATLVVPGLVVLVVGFLVLGWSPGYWVFVLGAVLLGVGKGLFAIPSRALLSELFVEHRGRAFGIYTAGTDLGGILSSVLAVVALGYATWRAPFVPIAVVLLALTVLYVAWNRESYETGDADLELRSTVRRLASTRRQREVLVAYALFYFFVGAFINFLPTYLEGAKEFTDATASGVFALVFVTGILVKPAAGSLSDRFPGPAIGAVGLVGATVAMAGLVLADGLVPVAVAIVGMALCYKTQFPIVDTLLLEVAPDENAGGDLGAARALFLGIGAFGPAYMGVVSTVAGYPVAFAGLALGLLAAAGIVARQWRRMNE